MSEKTIRIRSIIVLAAIIGFALVLQCTVVMFLSIRSSIMEEIKWSKFLVEREVSEVIHSDNVTLGSKNLEIIARDLENRIEQTSIFHCIFIAISSEQRIGETICPNSKEIFYLSQKAQKNKKTEVLLPKNNWTPFFFMGETALIAVPLILDNKEVIGASTVSRSLVPLYARYEQTVKIVFSYLVIHIILFVSVGFWWVNRNFFKPLNRLVKKTESYRTGYEDPFLVSEAETSYQKLSIKLNELFDRIEQDNKELRNNLEELEKVNKEIKNKNELVARSEKLAASGRLSAGLAHEIGNPLSIIQGYIDLLGRDDLESEEKGIFSLKAQQEIDRIKRLIRQLLDFAGTGSPAEEFVDISTFVDETVALLRVEKGDNNYKLKCQLSDIENPIAIDKDMLRQILINCLLNAVDSVSQVQGRDGEIVVQLTGGKVDITIKIIDNGVGILPENVTNVFDPFFTTKEVGKGTGLGLFVCHTLLELLNGTIQIENIEPYGAQVTIKLPVKNLQAQVEGNSDGL